MRTLKKGDQGSDVQIVQRCLSLTADAIFGSRTDAAVRKYQGINQLTVDGIVGAQTWEALEGNFPKEFEEQPETGEQASPPDKIDRAKFYDRLNKSLSQPQVDGFEAIFDYWESITSPVYSDWLPYVLATAWHETGTRMEPVRETFANTDQEAIDRLYPAEYAKVHENGFSYFGRGLVQLTWDYNYKSMGERLGVGLQLYNKPSLVLTLEWSVPIIVIGMIEGIFTGVGLPKYINEAGTDYWNARRIVNGTDCASKIQEYAWDFERCLI